MHHGPLSRSAAHQPLPACSPCRPAQVASLRTLFMGSFLAGFMSSSPLAVQVSGGCGRAAEASKGLARGPGGVLHAWPLLTPPLADAPPTGLVPGQHGVHCWAAAAPAGVRVGVRGQGAGRGGHLARQCGRPGPQRRVRTQVCMRVCRLPCMLLLRQCCSGPSARTHMVRSALQAVPGRALLHHHHRHHRRLRRRDAHLGGGGGGAWKA